MGGLSQIKKIFTQCWKRRPRDDDEAVRHTETKKGSTDRVKGLSEVAAPAPVENPNEESVYLHSTLEDNLARQQAPT